jgi:hypothetical protein
MNILRNFALSLTFCALVSACGEQQKPELNVALNMIYKEVDALDVMMSEAYLFDSPTFMTIWNNADYYYDQALSYIGVKEHRKEEKYIIAVAMQNLSLVNFLRLSRQAVELHKRDIIDKLFLKSLILSNARIADLTNEDVVIFLGELKKDNILEVDDYLNGRYKKGFLHWWFRGTHWPLR